MKNLSHQFEYEKISREIDNCEDLSFLREKCKELIKNHYLQKETFLNILKSN